MDLNFILKLLLVLISSSVKIKAQIDTTSCGEVCPQYFPKFIRPEVSKTYVYNLESKTLINVNEGQSVGIEARVEITTLSPCSFSLRLSQVELTGIPDPNEMQNQLELYPLKFGSFDGKILGICSTDNEELWVLNVKKSVLSALQMSAHSLTEESIVNERDFLGLCPTLYKLVESDNSAVTTIEKSKILIECEERRKYYGIFESQTISLLTEYFIQNFPIVKSKSVCTQQIQNWTITSVSCTEEQILEFQENSIIRSKLNIKFVEKTNGLPIRQESNSDSRTLLMQRKEFATKIVSESEIDSLLKLICSQIKDETLMPEITNSFHSLVNLLKPLSLSSVMRLIVTKTDGSVCAHHKDKIADLILRAVNHWLYAKKLEQIGKFIDITENMLKNEANYLYSLALDASFVIKKHREVRIIREEDIVISRIVDLLLNKLENCDKNIEKLTYLKAIDNLTPISNKSIKKHFLRMATNISLDSGVRVAVIQALTGITDEIIKDRLLEILKDVTQDIIVRYAAFRSVVMSRPTAKQWDIIHFVDDAEIGNFIKTFTRNVKKSSNPNRNKILTNFTHQFEDIPLHSFRMNQNIEFTHQRATLEIDTIYQKGSIIPALLVFNVWIPDEDKDFHLLELTIRQDGFDRYFEEFFEELKTVTVGTLLKFMENIKNSNHDLVLQITLKISGINILITDNFEIVHDMKTLVKKILEDDTLGLALGAVIFDSEVEIPTLNGFPMIVHLNNTVVAAFESNFVAKYFAKSKTNKIRMNYSLENKLSFGLTLKVGNYRPGFEYYLRFSFHPFIDAMIEENVGSILKARLNLPKKKLTLFELTQNTHLIDPNGQSLESDKYTDNSLISDEKIHCFMFYGLSMCKRLTAYVDYKIPDAEIFLTKIDRTMGAIELYLEAPKSMHSRENNIWIASTDAIDSEVDRKYSAELHLYNPLNGVKEARLKLQTPKNSFLSRASLFVEIQQSIEIIESEIDFPFLGYFRLKLITNRSLNLVNNEMKISYKLLQSEEESIQWIGKIIHSSNELKEIDCLHESQFISTQFSKYNMKITFHQKFIPFVSRKSELTIGWNDDYRDRIRLSYTSDLNVTDIRPLKITNENYFIIEATPFDINYELKLDIGLVFDGHKLQQLNIDIIGKDLNGRENFDFSGFLNYDRNNSSLNQTINVALKYAGHDFFGCGQILTVRDLDLAGILKFRQKHKRNITVAHSERIIFKNLKDMKIESTLNVNFSDIPDTYSQHLEIWFNNGSNGYFAQSFLHNGKKFIEFILRFQEKGPLRAYAAYGEKSVEIKVASIRYSISSEIQYKNQQNYCKIYFQEVPRISITFKLNSTLSKLKELEINLSTTHESSIKLLTDQKLEIEGNIDLISEKNRANIRVESPKIGYSHYGNIIYSQTKQLLTIDSKTIRSGKLYFTIEGQFSTQIRNYIIIEKIKSVDISKFECFYDSGSYRLVLYSSRFTVFIEGETKAKIFGKLEFIDKSKYNEYKSHYNVTNGVLSIDSISYKAKKMTEKFHVVIGLSQESRVELMINDVDTQLIVNPLGAKKTVTFSWNSPRYEQKSQIEIMPFDYFKFESQSERKVNPFGKFRINAIYDVDNDFFIEFSIPGVEWSARKTKSLRPKVIFNVTLNGYNKTQEYDVKQNLCPINNAFLILFKFFKSIIN